MTLETQHEGTLAPHRASLGYVVAPVLAPRDRHRGRVARRGGGARCRPLRLACVGRVRRGEPRLGARPGEDRHALRGSSRAGASIRTSPTSRATAAATPACGPERPARRPPPLWDDVVAAPTPPAELPPSCTAAPHRATRRQPATCARRCGRAEPRPPRGSTSDRAALRVAVLAPRVGMARNLERRTFVGVRGHFGVARVPAPAGERRARRGPPPATRARGRPGLWHTRRA